MMLGLYVHIPFCARRCPYCDFAVHIGASAQMQRDYLDALKIELQSTLTAHRQQFPRAQLSSIFFGGGTPTSIGADRLNDLLHLIGSEIPVAPNAEISLEGNPEDGSESEYQALLSGGWNRLSLGAQSFDDDVLKTLGRRHSAAQVEHVVQSARAAGWTNISLDLIYAVPGQTQQSWRDTLQRALQLQVTHLSCYSLTIEDGTAFGRRVQRGRMQPVSDDEQAEFMEDAEAMLSANGWERYEVSNYAQAGLRCRHNENYWSGGDYLAAGCGAHGHLNGHRWWNERSLGKYIERVRSSKTGLCGEEYLTAHQRLEELVLLGVRLRDGFDLNEWSQRLSMDVRSTLNDRLETLIGRGALESVSKNGAARPMDRIRLHPTQMCLADAVAYQLLGG